MKSVIKVIIHVHGGCVQDVLSNTQNIKVEIIDYDDQ